MKPIHFTVQEPRKRHHRELFDRDLPFRGRREQSKIQYRRRDKHPLKQFDA